MKLREIAELLSCELEGDGGIDINGVSTLERADVGQLSFFTNQKYHALAKSTRASAIITGLESPPLGRPLLRHHNPYLSFARALELFHNAEPMRRGVHPTAWVADSACIGPDVSVGPLSFVGEHAVIERGVQIRTRCVIESRVRIGEQSIIHSGSVLREEVVIGKRCAVHSNAVVGSDGFGYARTDDSEWYRIPQTGSVLIEDDVDIGAGTTIDRAAIGETRIGRGTKIDNLVHIGHGCQLGPHNLICAQVGLAGSTRSGSGVILAGQVGAAGHLDIGDGVLATAQTGIPHSIAAGLHISGAPAVEHKVWLKSSAAYSRLPDLVRSLRELERRVSDLERALQRSSEAS